MSSVDIRQFFDKIADLRRLSKERDRALRQLEQTVVVEHLGEGHVFHDRNSRLSCEACGHSVGMGERIVEFEGRHWHTHNCIEDLQALSVHK